MRNEYFFKVGFGRHGGGRNCGCDKNENLKFSPEEINSLLEHVKSVQYISTNLLAIKEELDAALKDFMGKGDNIDKISNETREAVFQLVRAISLCESRLNLLERNITNVVELGNNGLVPSDVIARYIQSYTQQFASEDQLASLDNALLVLGNLVTTVAVTANGAIQRTLMSIPNGIATLGADGKVPASQLPSFVEGIVECYKYGDEFYRPLENGEIKPNATNSDFTEETLVVPDDRHMYCDVETSKLYRWGGTVYAEISASPGSTDAVPEGSLNKYYTDAKVQAILNVHSNNSDIHVTTSDKQTWNAKYSKPSGGIPATDLATAVQNSLTKANSALQSFDVVLEEISMDNFDGIYPTGTYETTVEGLYDTLESISETGKAAFLQIALSNHTSSYVIPVWEKYNVFEGNALGTNGNYIITVTVDSSSKVTVKTRGFYDKPSGGIPKSDLSNELNTQIDLMGGYLANTGLLPNNLPVGAMILVELSRGNVKPVWFAGTKWVDANGTVVKDVSPEPEPEPDPYYYEEVGNDND